METDININKSVMEINIREKPEVAPTDGGEANDLLVGVSLPSPHPPHPTVGSPFQNVPYNFSFVVSLQISCQGFDS